MKTPKAGVGAVTPKTAFDAALVLSSPCGRERGWG
jgi:hypothetical protein